MVNQRMKSSLLRSPPPEDAPSEELLPAAEAALDAAGPLGDCGRVATGVSVEMLCTVNPNDAGWLDVAKVSTATNRRSVSSQHMRRNMLRSTGACGLGELAGAP